MMSAPRRIAIALIWIASVVATDLLAHAQAVVQRPDVLRLPQPPPPSIIAPTSLPIVLSGTDVGFRVTDVRGKTLIGKWVVRLGKDGEWVEPEIAR
jgi:hypothetical protein